MNIFGFDRHVITASITQKLKIVHLFLIHPGLTEINLDHYEIELKYFTKWSKNSAKNANNTAGGLSVFSQSYLSHPP